jgi:hypothetical protein
MLSRFLYTWRLSKTAPAPSPPWQDQSSDPVGLACRLRPGDCGLSFIWRHSLSGDPARCQYVNELLIPWLCSVRAITFTYHGTKLQHLETINTCSISTHTICPWTLPPLGSTALDCLRSLHLELFPLLLTHRFQILQLLWSFASSFSAHQSN